MAERRRAARVEGSHQLEQVAVDGLEPGERGHDDREERDERDHDQLRADPEPEPDHEQRGDQRDRDRLRGDQQRVDRAASGRRRSGSARPSRPPCRSPAAIPSTISRAVTRKLLHSGRAVVVQGGGDRVRGGQDQRIDATEVDVQLPRAEQGERAAAQAPPPVSRRHPERGRVPGRGARPARDRCGCAAAAARPSARRSRGPAAATSPRRGRRASTASSTSWVTSTTVRPSVSSTCASQACISARVIASSDANGSSSASTGLPASSERRNETRWRIPPDSSRGRARSKPASPKRSNHGAASARACARGSPRARSASRGVVERRQPREQQIALGHQRRGGRLDRAGVGALEPADQLEQRRLPAPARADDRDDLARRDLRA